MEDQDYTTKCHPGKTNAVTDILNMKYSGAVVYFRRKYLSVMVGLRKLKIG